MSNSEYSGHSDDEKRQNLNSDEYDDNSRNSGGLFSKNSEHSESSKSDIVGNGEKNIHKFVSSVDDSLFEYQKADINDSSEKMMISSEDNIKGDTEQSNSGEEPEEEVIIHNENDDNVSVSVDVPIKEPEKLREGSFRGSRKSWKSHLSSSSQPLLMPSGENKEESENEIFYKNFNESNDDESYNDVEYDQPNDDSEDTGNQYYSGSHNDYNKDYHSNYPEGNYEDDGNQIENIDHDHYDESDGHNEQQTYHEDENVDNQEEIPEAQPKRLLINDIAAIAIKTGDVSQVNYSNLDKVLARIKQIQKDASDKGDYELAKYADYAYQDAIQHVNEERYLEISQSKKEELNYKLLATENDLDYLREHWAQVLENAKIQANTDIEVLHQENQNAIKEFDMMIDSELPIQYRKPSSKLLDLRKKQKAMMSSKRFIEAKEVKREADKLERYEKAQNLERYKKKQEADRVRLINKLENKIYARQQNWVRTIEGIQRIASYEIEHASRSVRNLKEKIESYDQAFTRYSMTANAQTQPYTQTQLSNYSRDMAQQPQSYSQGTLHPVQPPRTAHNRNSPNSRINTTNQYRQRAMINRITYSHIVVPKIKKPRTSR